MRFTLEEFLTNLRELKPDHFPSVVVATYNNISGRIDGEVIHTGQRTISIICGQQMPTLETAYTMLEQPQTQWISTMKRTWAATVARRIAETRPASLLILYAGRSHAAAMIEAAHTYTIQGTTVALVNCGCNSEQFNDVPDHDNKLWIVSPRGGMMACNGGRNDLARIVEALTQNN